MNIFRTCTIILMFLTGLPLVAQEEGGKMAPPPPLEDDYISWMIGEWQGVTSSQMGKSNDYMKCEMGVNDQFLIITYKSDADSGRSIWGLGAITHDPDGNSVGYWIDSWRTMYTGKGFREGNISVIKWSTSTGTYVRTTEKIDESTMRVTGAMTGSDGHEMQSETEFKRLIK